MRNRSRIGWVLLSALFLTLVLAGCGSSSGADDSLNRVKQAGKLVIGVDDAYAPMEFRDENGNLVGFDIDMMAEVGKRLGVEIEWQPTAWDGIIPALVTKQFDVIVSSMNITEERQKEVNFSDPYLHMGQMLMVASGNPHNITTPADLKGKVVAVQIGTTNETYARSIEGVAEVRVFDTFPMAFEEVLSGRAHATVADTPIGVEFVMNNPGKAELVGEEIDPLPVGIAIRKEDNALRAELNKILKSMQEDGTMDQLKAKWFKKG